MADGEQRIVRYVGSAAGAPVREYRFVVRDPLRNPENIPRPLATKLSYPSECNMGRVQAQDGPLFFLLAPSKTGHPNDPKAKP